MSALGYNPAEIYVMALGIPAGQYNPNFACKGGQHLKNAYIRTDTVHVTHSMKFTLLNLTVPYKGQLGAL